jgi:hypothetical protein
MYLVNLPNNEAGMDFTKYIIHKNIPQFRSAINDNKKVLKLDVQSYQYYTQNKSGRRRAILSSSVKWSKVEGLKNIGVTGLYLAPATTIQGLNTCKFSGECKHGCIAFTGNLGMFHRATIENRTLALFNYTERYLVDMLRELYLQCFKASIDGKELYCRLNGTSDLPFYKVLNMDLIVNDFNGLAGFYDYTKYPVMVNPWQHYDITYSMSETDTAINLKYPRVAFVVSKKDKFKLLNDYPFVFTDGDLHDVRPLDRTNFVLLQAKRATATDKQVSDDFIYTIEDIKKLIQFEVVK